MGLLRTLLFSLAVAATSYTAPIQAADIDFFAEEAANDVVGLVIEVHPGADKNAISEKLLRLAREYSLPVDTVTENFDNWLSLTFKSKLSRTQIRPIYDYLKQQDWVKTVEPNRTVSLTYVTNDPDYDSGKTSDGWELLEDEPASTRGQTAWNIRGTSPIVAVIDSGLLFDPDILSPAESGWDFYLGRGGAIDYGNGVPHCPQNVARETPWHGNQMTSIIAAMSGNGLGMASLNQYQAKAVYAKHVPIRIYGCSESSTEKMANAIRWAVGQRVASAPSHTWKARVINISMATEEKGNCPSYLQSAIDTARSYNSVVVVSAGNYGGNSEDYTPANCNGVIVVAAHDRYGNHHFNKGRNVTVSAPGVGVRIRRAASNSYANQTVHNLFITQSASGTSPATAFVSATAARILAANEWLKPDEVRDIIQSTARPFIVGCTTCGAGMLDTFAAVSKALPDPIPVNLLLDNPTEVSIYSNPPQCFYSEARVYMSDGSINTQANVTFAQSKAFPPTGSVVITKVSPTRARICARQGVAVDLTLTASYEGVADSRLVHVKGSAPPCQVCRKR